MLRCVDERLVGARRCRELHRGRGQNGGRRSSEARRCRAGRQALVRRAETARASPASASAAPKVHTMVAPVGRSKANEEASPAALASVPVDPADRELSRRRRGVDHADGGRDDQEREHQQHAGDRDRARHHDAEGRVEHELPGERSACRRDAGAAASARRRPRRRAARSPQARRCRSVRMLPVRICLRCSAPCGARSMSRIDGRGGNDIDDADQRFLRHARRPMFA